MFDASALPLFDFQMELQRVALSLMLRGLRVDLDRRAALESEVVEARRVRLEAIAKFLGREVSSKLPGSRTQMTVLFEAVGLKPLIHRKTGRPTFDDEALTRLAKHHPEFRTLLYNIVEYRALGTMLSNFIQARLESDGRLRCSFNTAGPPTFRWSSSRNAFYRGCNHKNLTTGDRGLTGAKLPNLRTIIVPDDGHLLFEPDLKGADAQAVAWDSGDSELKRMFREGVAIHAETAKELFGEAAGPDGRTEPYYTLAKKARHAYHYASSPRTVAISIGIKIIEAQASRDRLWRKHPAIPQWHKRIEAQVRQKPHKISNPFGYSIYYFDRVAGLLPDALAWIGQGVVACVANRVGVNIHHNVPKAVLLLNEHDSWIGQCRIEDWEEVCPALREQFRRVVVPYDDPLVIQPELKVSTKSWGEMEKAEW